MRKITTSKTAKLAATLKTGSAKLPAPSPQAAKPVKHAAKPTAKAETARSERVELLGTERKRVASFYNGPSLTVHASRHPKLSDCVERIAKPIQRADNPSVRDESLLLAIGAHADKSGAFDPSTFGCDLGVISRLASLGFLTVNSANMPALTKAGTERAASVKSRAAKPVKSA